MKLTLFFNDTEGFHFERTYPLESFDRIAEAFLAELAEDIDPDALAPVVARMLQAFPDHAWKHHCLPTGGGQIVGYTVHGESDGFIEQIASWTEYGENPDVEDMRNVLNWAIRRAKELL